MALPRPRAACVLAATIALVTSAAHAQTNAPSVAQAVGLLEEIARRFTQLQSLQYHAERVSTVGRRTVTERWRFAYRSPDRLRLEYLAPQVRLVTATPDVLWEYIPAAGKALKTDLRKLEAEDRSQRLLQSLARVALEGLHPSPIEPFKARATRAALHPADAGLWVLEGESPRYRLTLEPVRKLLMASEVYDDQGNLTIKTEAADAVNLGSEGWFPGRIRVSHLLDAETIVSEVRLTDVQLNQPVADNRFEFTPPPRVRVMTPDR